MDFKKPCKDAGGGFMKSCEDAGGGFRFYEVL